jgi:hypothetical protein
MAIGRRKLLAQGALSTTGSTTVYTAGAAPADGSAAATITAGRLANASGSPVAVTATVNAQSYLLYQYNIPANSWVDLPVVDLMGGATLALTASVANVLNYTLSGVEAKDS